MIEEKIIEELPNGIRLTFIPTDKFKTVSAGFFMHQELRGDLATQTALLPAVLERGSSRHPDNLTLRRELERLYGAELSMDVHKKGERQIVSCSLEIVHGKYVGEDEELLRRGLSIMASLVYEPLVENGSFKEEYVAQEKEQLAREIRGLINDKASYAMEKCVETMCAGERFGTFRLGDLESLRHIDAAALWRYYGELVAANPVDIYMVGEMRPETVSGTVRDIFSRERKPRAGDLLPEDISRKPGAVRFYEEKMNVNQAKLVLGYRTSTGYSDPLYFALLMYNGILGAFPHSKLFLNVREKASLAYYVYSRLERHKGLMLIAAGIDGANCDRARSIIEKQLEAMARGKISEMEMDNTRRGLLNHLRSLADNPYQLINFHLDGTIGGKNYDIDEMIQGIESVTTAEIKEVAARVRPDTVYLLREEKGGSGA